MNPTSGALGPKRHNLDGFWYLKPIVWGHLDPEGTREVSIKGMGGGGRGGGGAPSAYPRMLSCLL